MSDHYVDVASQITKYDLTECEFLFTVDEIRDNIDNDFYIFLFGRHLQSRNSTVRCIANWKDSIVYKLGLERAELRIDKSKKPILTPKTKVKSETRKFDRNLFGYAPVSKYKNIPIKQGKIMLNKVVIDVEIPYIDRLLGFKPEIGLNFAKEFKKLGHKYCIGNSTYYFGWNKTAKFEDVTRLFIAKMEWPKRLDRLYYDRSLDISILGGYPYLAYLIRNNYSYGTKDNFEEFKLCLTL